MDPLYLEALKSSNDLKQPLRKVPGEVVPIGKLSHEVKAFRESILKKNIPELQEVLSRQNLILSNEKLVSKLPDKGAKLKEKVREIENLIESRKKAVEDAADMLEGLKLDPTNNLIDTEAMEWKHGGAMFKHLNLPANEDKKSEDTEDTANVLSILASKEVPNAKHLDYTLELALRGDSQKKDPLKNAPFNQLKKEVLDTKDKTKIPLQHTHHKSNIRDGKVEVMPLPPKNYSELKVKELDLRESIILQQEQDKKLKKIQLQNALDKLTSGSGGSSNDHLDEKIRNFEGDETAKMAYRDEENDSSEDEDEVENENKSSASENESGDEN